MFPRNPVTEETLTAPEHVPWFSRENIGQVCARSHKGGFPEIFLQQNCPWSII